MSMNPLSAEAFTDWLRQQPLDTVYEYHDSQDCLYHRYLKEKGFPVKAVGGSYWVDEDGHDHSIPDRVMPALAHNGRTTYGHVLERLENGR